MFKFLRKAPTVIDAQLPDDSLTAEPTWDFDGWPSNYTARLVFFARTGWDGVFYATDERPIFDEYRWNSAGSYVHAYRVNNSLI